MLEDAFAGDPGARVFVQAALRTARRTSLPAEPAAILDFARAHLVGPLTEELGPRAVAEFLDNLTNAVRPREASGVEVSESGVRSIDADLTALDSPSVPPATSSATSSATAPATSRPATSRPDPRSEEPASSSNPPRSSGSRVRIRTLLVYSDRFTRASLARQLVAASCDVTVIDSIVDIASVEEFPGVAIVDLAAREVDLVLSAMVARNPQLRVVALLGGDALPDDVLTAARVKKFQAVPRSMRAPELVEMLRRLVG
ncbi:MAG: hypothetical protein JNL79_05715 [Myxococcales bacterium]|nr:hypothetical protein [Myxococcales bacterium]